MQKEGNMTTINVSLRGFNSSTTQLHGFHVHENGDLGNQCSDAGGHYNPKDKTHGAPTDTERYVCQPFRCQVTTLGKVFTQVLRSAKSIIQYWPKGGDVLRLRR